MDKFVGMATEKVAAQAEDVAMRVAEHGREAGERIGEVEGNVKGAVDKVGEGSTDGPH